MMPTLSTVYSVGRTARGIVRILFSLSYFLSGYGDREQLGGCIKWA